MAVRELKIHRPGGYHAVAARLRQQWLGDWQPGQALPPREQLRAQLSTTYATLQRAMDLLASQGFVETRPTVGTYLAQRPPQQCRIGLVFPGHPDEVVRSWHWSRHYLANLRAAEAFNSRQRRWRIVFYLDVSPGSGKGLARLRRDIDDQALAGLIFSYSPHDLVGVGLLEQPPLPIVHYNPDFGMPGMAIRLGDVGFWALAAAWAAGRRCDRIAVLTVATTHGQGPDEIRADLEACGLHVPPHWLQRSDPHRPEWLPNLLAAMLRGPELPQALIITDDHLVEPAVAALDSLPHAASARLAVLGHWNFRLPYGASRPITRLGADAADWLTAGVELIAANPGPPAGLGPVSTIPFRLVPESECLREAGPSVGGALKAAREVLLQTCQ